MLQYTLKYEGNKKTLCLYFLNGGGQFRIFMYKAHRSPCFQSKGEVSKKDCCTEPLI